MANLVTRVEFDALEALFNERITFIADLQDARIEGLENFNAETVLSLKDKVADLERQVKDALRQHFNRLETLEKENADLRARLDATAVEEVVTSV